MRSLFKKFIAIMTLSTIFITSANAVYVYRYQQEQTNWCWAASAQMMGTPWDVMLLRALSLIMF